jgi:hypothetical protein
MRQRTAKTDEQIFILKIIQSNCYGTIKDLPYRVLEVPREYTLYQLARAINDSFGFYFDHPFGFYNHLTRYYDATEAYKLFADDRKPVLSVRPLHKASKEYGRTTYSPKPERRCSSSSTTVTTGNSASNFWL